MLMIAPIWRAQHWYPLLLNDLDDFLMTLPVFPDLLMNPRGDLHPQVLNHHLQLATWPVSRDPVQIDLFQRKLLHGEKGHQSPTNQHGNSGAAGVFKVIPIHFWLLLRILLSYSPPNSQRGKNIVGYKFSLPVSCLWKVVTDFQTC